MLLSPLYIFFEYLFVPLAKYIVYGKVNIRAFGPNQGQIQNFTLQEIEVKKKKKKSVHIVLTNYKYIKLLFLNILRYNHNVVF